MAAVLPVTAGDADGCGEEEGEVEGDALGVAVGDGEGEGELAAVATGKTWRSLK